MLCLSGSLVSSSSSSTSTSTSTSTPTPTPLPSCESALDAACVPLCFDNISGGCDGPMLARHSGPGDPPEWRCYSPSNLDAETQEEYVSGSCYCSCDDELSEILALCERGVTTVFSPEFDGDYCYRIPSIVRLAASGLLLAFAEQRQGGCSDKNPSSLVLRRSADDGANWGPIITVDAAGGRTLSNPNPVEVVFPNGTRAVLFHYDTMNNPSSEASETHGSNLQRWSFDEGQTWSAPGNITGFMPPGYEGCMPGPSVGLQQQSQQPQKGGEEEGEGEGAGTTAETIYFSCHEGKGAFLYFSSDMGATWNHSAPVEGLNECSVALLPNRSVAMNCRASDGRSQLTFSEAGELLRGPFKPYPGLDDPGCQGSIVAAPVAPPSTTSKSAAAQRARSPHPSTISAEDEDEDDAAGAGAGAGAGVGAGANSAVTTAGTLFLSNDATSSGRANMTVRRSDDAGATWDDGLLVWNGPSAYSQLVVLPATVPSSASTSSVHNDKNIKSSNSSSSNSSFNLGLLFELGTDSKYQAIGFTVVAPAIS
jgi:sialidase-1